MKTFELLPDLGWIWLDFQDFKHDYIKEVNRSNVCLAARGPRTSDLHGDCNIQSVTRFHKIWLAILFNIIGFIKLLQNHWKPGVLKRKHA